MIYFDNASTSYPKPAILWRAMRDYMSDVGVSPIRGAHRPGMAASQLVDAARRSVATLFGISDPTHVVFTHNATHALNIAIKGVLGPDDHVVTTTTEHNSTLRPLEALRRGGVIDYTAVAPNAGGAFDLAAFAAAFRPNTRLVAVNHASNVTGAVAPVREMFEIARQRGAICLLDASQTAGFLDIDVEELGVDLLAFTGHKWLYGPSGTGGLFVREPRLVRPLHYGATGRISQSLRQPMAMPAKFETGTLNYLGIAALLAVMDSRSADSSAQTEGRLRELMGYMYSHLAALPEIITYPLSPEVPQIPVLSINVRGFFPSEVGGLLDENFSIIVRTGLHCAPLIHRSLGSAPHGTVRISMGANTVERDVDALIAALSSISSFAPRHAHG